MYLVKYIKEMNEIELKQTLFIVPTFSRSLCVTAA